MSWSFTTARYGKNTSGRRKLPAGVPWQAAVCLDPTEFALGAVRDGNVRIGDAVAIFGMGAIGLIAVQLAKLAGADPVIATDPLPLRRGTVVAGAYPAPYPAGLDLGAEAHMNRPKLVFSRACSEPNPDYPAWNEERLFTTTWRLLTSGAIQAEVLIQLVVSFDDLLVEYPKIATHPHENIKLGVHFALNIFEPM